MIFLTRPLSLSKKYIALAAIIFLSGSGLVTGILIQSNSVNKKEDVLASKIQVHTPTQAPKKINKLTPTLLITSKNKTKLSPTAVISSTNITAQNSNNNSAGGNSNANISVNSNSTEPVNPTSYIAPPANTSPTPRPTVFIVRHPGGTDGIVAVNGDFEIIYVTPTPNTSSYEATFSYNEGLGIIIANKPYKSCHGKQTETIDNMTIEGILNGRTRWGCPNGKCGYICEINFAPPNTPRYNLPYGVKVVSEQDEEKTFANW